jgi:ATP-dependent Zn protease
MNAMEQRKLTAYHEAGHVVAAHVLELDITGVTIVPGEESFVRYLGQAGVPVDYALVYDSDRADDYLERQLVCYYAGAAAEEVLTGEPVDWGPRGYYRSDWNGSADCVVELAGHDSEKQAQVSESGWVKAQTTMAENWDKVRTLAEALIEHGKLDGDSVERLLGDDEGA